MTRVDGGDAVMVGGNDGQSGVIANKPAHGAGLLALVVLGIGVWPGWAQNATSQPAGAASPAVGRPRYARTTRIPDALLGSPRRQVVILPSQPGEMGEDPEQLSQGTQKKLAADLPLLPEGYVVAAREARIHQRGRWYVVELAKAEGLPNAPPLRVLPNQRLAMLEAILSRPDAPPVFVVTGRVTEFLGANYLLLENLEELSSRSAGPPGRPESAPETGAATRPAAATAEPTAEEIMQRLLDHKTLRPVVLPDRAPTADDGAGLAVEDDPSVAAAAKQGITWPEEALLVDRIGRVVPGKLWWMFVFEDQGRHPMHKPIRLLPNQLLETAVALSRGGTQGMVFVTSGEVTLHRGMNYLLLRKVLVRRDLGNFR